MIFKRCGDGRRLSQEPTVALLPVKRLDQAKSRLAALGDELRRDLALAFVLDTLNVVQGVEGVAEIVVVTDDETVRREVARRPGVRLAAGGAGLNVDLVAAAGDARGRHPAARLLVVCTDLPALRASELQHLLACPQPYVAVPDRHGSGTTALLCAGDFAPRFEGGSFSAHLADGASGLHDAGAGLRCDVDTPDDLAYARGLGLGDRTRAVERRQPGP